MRRRAPGLGPLLLALTFAWLLPLVSPGAQVGPAAAGQVAPGPPIVALPPVLESDERWGVNHVFAPAAPQRLARNAGVRWTRWEFRWDEIEPQPGRYDWESGDGMVRASQNTGLKVQGILISIPAWALDPNTQLPRGLNLPYNHPDNLWTGFVKQIVTKYGGRVRHWEVWNEPDYAELFWPGTYADYYQMLRVTYQMIKSVDRSAQVLFAGLAYWQDPSFLEEILALAMADPNARSQNYFFDILALHSYSNPTDVYNIATSSREKLLATVGPRPIWFNELHVPAWDEGAYNNFQPYTYAATAQEQASYIVQAGAYALAANVERLFIYRFSDTDPEAFGLLRMDGSMRPSYVAYQVAARHLSNVTSAALARQGDVEQIIGVRANERVVAAWNRSPRRLQASIGAAALQATQVDQWGNTQPVRASGGQYQLSLPPATANQTLDPDDYMIGGFPYILVEQLPPGDRIEESSPSIGYSAGWVSTPALGASAGVVRRTTTSGVAASVDFEGSSLTLTTSKGPNRGSLRVMVDGVSQGDVDLFSPTELWNVPLTFGEFGPGVHRLTVVALGQRSPLSTGPIVDLDTITAQGLRAAPAPPTIAPLPTPTATPTPSSAPSPSVAPPGATAPPALSTPTVVASPTTTRTPPPVMLFSSARREAAAYRALPGTSTSAALPMVIREPDGWRTSIALQNADQTPVDAVVYFVDGSGSFAAALPLALPVGGSSLVDTGDVPELAAGFSGAALIDSTGWLAVVATHLRDGPDAFSYSAISTGAQQLHAPLLFRGYSGWTSSVWLQNLGTDVAEPTIAFRANGPDGESWTESRSLPPGAAVTIGLTDTQAPAAWVGSASIRGGEGSELAAVVQQRHESGVITAYDTASAGSTTLYAPLLAKNADGWSSGLQIHNLGDAETVAVVTYLSSASTSLWLDAATLPARGAATFYLPSNRDLPEGFVGSARITSSDDQPLAAIVNHARLDRGMAATYRAPTGGSQGLLTPFLARGWNGWNTEVQVQNLGDVSAIVSMQLHGPDGTLSRTVSNVVRAGASHRFNLSEIEGLPDQWSGSAVLTSKPPQPLAAVVNQARS